MLDLAGVASTEKDRIMPYQQSAYMQFIKLCTKREDKKTLHENRYFRSGINSMANISLRPSEK